MVTKMSTYWLLSILILTLCLTLNFDSNKHPKLEPIDVTNLIKVQPKFLYRRNNTFYALVVGQLRIDIKLDGVAQDITQYNLFVVNDLAYKTDTKISLNWKVNDKSFQVPLTLSTKSYTPINFQTKNINEVSDLHLMIIQDSTFGTDHSFQDEIKFKSISFNHTDNQETFAIDTNNWLAFNPINFGSVNSYTTHTSMIYQSLILRLSIWMMVTVLLFLILKISKKHLLFSFLIGWFITAFFYLNNRFHQNLQLNNSFPEETSFLNLTDKVMYHSAKKIKSALSDMNIAPTIEQKIVIIGPSDFSNQRLLTYLNEYNVALKIQMQEVLSTVKYQNTTYLLINGSFFYCDYIRKYPEYMKLAEIIHSDSNLCIIKSK